MPNSPTEQDTRFVAAVICGNARTVEECIQQGANINFQINSGMSPLSYAASMGYVACVKVLLENGAFDDKTYNETLHNDIMEHHPLMGAAMHDHYECMELLIQYGADINYKNSRGISALAVAMKQNSSSCIEVLWRHGVKMSMNIKHVLKKKVSEICKEHPKLHLAAAEGNDEKLKLILEGGADINALNSAGETALHIAVRSASVPCVHILLNKQADLGIRNKKGLTALHISAETHNKDLMAILIEKNAFVNATDQNNITPLHIATGNGQANCAFVNVCVHNDQAKCVQLLLKNGADVNAKDKANLTPLHLAVSSHATGCIKLLKSKGADIFAECTAGFSPLDLSTMEGLQFFTLLLKKADVNKRGGSEGMAPMHVAARYSPDCLKLLLQWKGKVNIKMNDGYTPLHVAAETGNKICTKLLVQHNANINAKEEHGDTPLHFSVAAGQKECVKLLLQNGANVNVISSQKRTPLHYAVISGQTDCARLLLEHGCVINPKDKYGVTPLGLAGTLKKMDCYNLLAEKMVIPFPYDLGFTHNRTFLRSMTDMFLLEVFIKALLDL